MGFIDPFDTDVRLSDTPVSGGVGAVLKRGKQARANHNRDTEILAASAEQIDGLARELGVSREGLRLHQKRLEAVIAQQMKE